MSAGWTRLYAKTAESESMAELIDEHPRVANLWFLMVSNAGVWGRFPGSRRAFRHRVCGLCESLSGEQLEAALGELEAREMIRRYTTSDGQEVIEIVNHFRYNPSHRWDRVGAPEFEHLAGWQPPESLLQYLQDVAAGKYQERSLGQECAKFGVEPGVVQDCSGTTPRESVPRSQSQGATPKAAASRVDKFGVDPGVVQDCSGTTPRESVPGSQSQGATPKAAASRVKQNTEVTEYRDTTSSPPYPPTGGGGDGDGSGKGSIRRLKEQPERPSPSQRPEAREDWDQTTHIITCEENEVRGTLATVCPTMPVADQDAWVMDIVKSIRDPNNPLDRAGMIQALTESPPRVTQRTAMARSDHLERLIKRHYARTQESQARASPRRSRGPLPPSDLSRVKTNEYGEVISDG